MNTTRKTIKRVEYDLKPHNVATIEKILEFYKTSNKCCAIQATGTGKTFLILRLLEIYNDEDKIAVIFAPNNEIIKQTKKRMKKFGLNNATFYTYQKLARMTDEEISAMEFDLIVCDELHRTGAKTWGHKFEVLVNSHPDSKVFGVTATPLRCADGRDMAEEYFDGNKACDISLAEALVREIIPVMPLYVSALYTFEEEYQNMSEKIEKANNSMEEKLELQKELLAAKQQLEKANGVPEIIKKYITNYNGKYLVFCKDKKHLYAMKDVVVGWFRDAGYDGKIFEYPYYSNSSAVKKNLENFENNKEEGLKLLFIIDKLNEGLHLDEVHGCILLRTTVSNIIYYQQIGRAIDAGSMEQRVILDLVSNFNSLQSFNLKKELEQKVRERRNGNFSDCSEDFELDKFEVEDFVQDCKNIFNEIDEKILENYMKWKTEEDEFLINFYQDKGMKYCLEHLNHRNKSQIQNRVHFLGLSSLFEWTEDKIQWLRTNYSNGIKYCAEYLNTTPKSVEGCARKYGMTEKKKWDEEKIIKLSQLINEGKTIEECADVIGLKTDVVRCKASKLKLLNSREWSKDEDDIVLKLYPIMGKQCKKYLPNRSELAIQRRAQKMGIKEKDMYSKRRKSKYRYVTFDSRKNRWRVVIYIGGKGHKFGTFKTEDEAGKVAMEKAKEYGKIF